MGFTSGAGVFTSQYWGKRDIDGIGRSFGFSISLSVVSALVSYKESKEDAANILLFAVGLSALFGLGSIYASPYFTMPYESPERMQYLVMTISAAFSLALPFKVINTHVIAGILRAGGDTKYGAFLDIFAVWGVGLPVAAIATYLYGCDLPTVFALVLLEEFLKSALGIYRMSQGVWLKTLV